MAAHEHNDEHGGMGHVMSIRALVGVFLALLMFTVITVSVSKVDFGGRTVNLSIAMLIAIIKASLVILYFMHLRYDKLFHGVILIAALLGAFLFVGFTLVDRGQYENAVIWDEQNPPTLSRPAPPLTPVEAQ